MAYGIYGKTANFRIDTVHARMVIRKGNGRD